MAVPITTLRNLADAVLAAAPAVLYTVPALTRAAIRSAQFCNTTAAVVALTVTVQARTGGTVRTLLSAHPVAVNETYPGYELLGVVLEAGGTVQASGLGVTAVLSGVEVVG
jgi:hypothetical protein